jgi:hypothetical protein
MPPNSIFLHLCWFRWSLVVLRVLMNRQNWYLAPNIFYDLSTKSMTVVDTPNLRVGNALFFTEVVRLILSAIIVSA